MVKSIPTGQLQHVKWGCLTADQWRALSVVTVTKPSSKDGGGDEDRSGTPYDPVMGEQRNHTLCATCNKPNTECPGHFGIIELPFPVYNKMYIPIVLKILQCICMHCARPCILPEHFNMHGITNQKSQARLKLIATKCKNIKKCPWSDCGETLVEFSEPVKNKSETGIIYYSVSHDKITKRQEFNAGAAYTLLSRISNEHIEALGFNDNLYDEKYFKEAYTDPRYLNSEDHTHVHLFRPEAMIFTVLPVLPPLARPWVISDNDDGEKKDDDLTDKYNSVLKSINLWKTFNPDGTKIENSKRTITARRGTMKTKLDIEHEIMEHIWTLIDNKNEKSKLNSGGRAHRSINDRLTGKDGRVQSNVGGKRCDFSARTVIIGGGIRLKNDELGIPREIAENLTKLIYVGPWNIDYVQKLISEGKVNSVQRDGNRRRLCSLPDKGKSYRIQPGDIIERQLQDGDKVLFNRQPTLRIESMMGFSAKIVDGMAFLLGLCFTKPFNADFDGKQYM